MSNDSMNGSVRSPDEYHSTDETADMGTSDDAAYRRPSDSYPSFDVEAVVGNIMKDIDREMEEIVEDTSKEVRRCIEGNWEPEPSLKKEVIARWTRAKWARLKRGLTSEEAQQLAEQIAVYGASYLVGRAIGYGIGSIYKKLTSTNEG